MARKVYGLQFIALLLFTLPLLISCSREVQAPSTLAVELPRSFQTKGARTMIAAIPEHYVVAISLNDVQVATRHWDANQGAPPAAFEFTNIEIGNIAVRVLAIFSSVVEGESADVFAYGESIQNITSTEKALTITLQEMGSGSGVETRIVGRYITEVVDGELRGPTGDVIYQLKVHRDVPPIEVVRKEMFNGWFDFFALEDLPFKVVLASDPSKVIFDSLANPAALAPAGATNRFSARAPASIFYREQHSNNDPVEFRPSHGANGGMVVGFFGPAVESGAFAGAVCYQEQSTSGHEFTFLYSQAVDNPQFRLKWFTDPNNPLAANHFRRITGGLANTASACSAPADEYKTYINFSHQNFNYGGLEGGPGINGPLTYQQTFSFSNSSSCSSGGGYAGGCYTSSTNSVEVKWKYLPGAKGKDSASPVNKNVDSMSVFFRVGTSTSSNDNRFHSEGEVSLCEEFGDVESTEFSDFKSVNVPANSESVNFSLSSFGLTLASGQRLETVLCPKFADGTFARSITQVHSIGNFGCMSCGGSGGSPTPSPTPGGSSTPTPTPIPSLSFFGGGSDGSMTHNPFPGGATIGLSSMTLGGGKKFSEMRRITSFIDQNKITIPPTPSLDGSHYGTSPGEAVAWIVMAAGGTGCGGGLNPGRYSITTITHINTSTGEIHLADPFPSGFNSSNLANAPVAGGGNFCLMQLVRVPQFENLSFDSANAGTPGLDIQVPQFDMATGTGGVLFMLVRNTLTLTGANPIKINASSVGYDTGTSGTAGASISGVSTNSFGAANSTGGGGISGGGGGGGGGNRGTGGGSAASGANVSCLGSPTDCTDLGANIFMGGGGGGSAGDPGGRGGGIVVIHAANLVVNGGPNKSIVANGGSGLGSASPGGGGGAGGSIFVVAGSNSLSSTLTLEANGGGGGGSSPAGGGGGGAAAILSCQSYSASPSITVFGGSNGGASGSGPPPVSDSNLPFCGGPP